jgi:2-keto-4-pentenoate hydratase/2-oxohepta-3-ene-1,7-dioic acid hydratase in catechol pathway
VPIVFTKTLETVIGTGTDILYPEGISSAIDYEAELALVIGKEGRRIETEYRVAARRLLAAYRAYISSRFF